MRGERETRGDRYTRQARRDETSWKRERRELYVLLDVRGNQECNVPSIEISSASRRRFAVRAGGRACGGPVAEMDLVDGHQKRLVDTFPPLMTC